MKASHLTWLFLVTCMLYACGKAENEIKRELQINPALRSQNIEVALVDYKEGYVTLEIAGLPLPSHLDRQQEVIKAYRSGTNWSDMRLYVWNPPQINALISVEEALLKRPDVKSIHWKWREADAL